MSIKLRPSAADGPITLIVPEKTSVGDPGRYAAREPVKYRLHTTSWSSNVAPAVGPQSAKGDGA